MAWAYFERAAADNVVHAEIFFDPQTHTDARRADRDRDRRPGPCLPPRARRARHQRHADPVLPAPPERRGRVRHAGAGAALSRTTSSASASTAASAATRRRSSPASSRAAASSACTWSPMPARRARRPTSERARRAEGRAHRPRRALPRETRRWCSGWRRERMPLTVCPLSNVKLCVFKTHGRAQPAGAARRPACAPPSTATTRRTSAATSTTTSSPTFDALPQLGAREAYALARNSFEASFAPPADKARWTRALDAVFAHPA